MPGIRYPLIINGAAVAAAPAEIDDATTEQLRMVSLDAAGRGHRAAVRVSPTVRAERRRAGG